MARFLPCSASRAVRGPGAGLVRGDRPPYERAFSADAVNPSMEASRKRPCFRDRGKRPLVRRPADLQGRSVAFEAPARPPSARLIGRERSLELGLTRFLVAAGQQLRLPDPVPAWRWGRGFPLRTCQDFIACEPHRFDNPAPMDRRPSCEGHYRGIENMDVFDEPPWMDSRRPREMTLARRPIAKNDPGTRSPAVHRSSGLVPRTIPAPVRWSPACGARVFSRRRWRG
jgi:hypothetical protein